MPCAYLVYVTWYVRAIGDFMARSISNAFGFVLATGLYTNARAVQRKTTSRIDPPTAWRAHHLLVIFELSTDPRPLSAYELSLIHI